MAKVIKDLVISVVEGIIVLFFVNIFSESMNWYKAFTIFVISAMSIFCLIAYIRNFVRDTFDKEFLSVIKQLREYAATDLRNIRENEIKPIREIDIPQYSHNVLNRIEAYENRIKKLEAELKALKSV